MKKALIFGASGQVGQALIMELEARGWDWEGSYFEHAEVDPHLFRLDLGDLASIRREILTRRPQAIFLPSGWTWVDGCEDDPQRARHINALAPEAAAGAAALLNCALVYYSTEYVFGEQGGPYDELRAPQPLGVYGASKLEGELRVQEAWPASIVIRTTVVYGPEVQGKNFVYQLRRQLQSGKPITVPKDQISSPTYNRDLARASVELVQRRLQGIYNVAGQSCLDRYAFSKMVAKTFGLDEQLIQGQTTAAMNQKARRPLGAGLLSGKFTKALGWAPSGVEVGLERMKSELEGKIGH